jgi:quinohemoprotein amine dehydrogenase
MHLRLARVSAFTLIAAALAFSQESVPLDSSAGLDPTKETEPGIPVTDKLTIAKCSGCHQRDAYGNLTRISWIRTTPEGWEEAIKRMVELNGLKLEREEALQIVRYLSHDHGLAPEETQPVRWYLEMTLPQTEAIPNETIRHTCAGCHAFARPETWRRSSAEWHLLKNMHVGYFPLSEFINFTQPPARNRVVDPNAPKPKEPAEQALEYLTKNFDLYSASWSNWRAQMTDPDLSGRWLITATLPGKGKFFGEMSITKLASGEFKTDTSLTSAKDGSKWQLPGQAIVYTGYEWRGSGKSESAGPVRQVMTVSRDQSTLEGRWFWGAYQEFGFTVRAKRAGRDMSVLGTDVASLRAGSKAVPVKIFGEHFPADLKPADINLGAGITVAKVVSVTPSALNVLADAEPKVIAGMRSVAVRGHVAPDAFSAYEKIDYIKVGAETALAHTGGTVAKKGYVQYEADAYSNGLDGIPNTSDDVNLGPVPVKWSIEEFISHQNDTDKEFVGYIDSNGLFTPSGDGPNPQRRFSADNVGDVWVVAELPNEKKDEPPLQAKSYLVVAVPDFLRFDSPEVASR